MADRKSPEQDNALHRYAYYSNLGFEMAALIAAGVFGGIKLDKLAGTSPLLTVVLSLAGVTLSMYLLIKKTMPPSTNKTTDEQKNTH